MKVAAAAVTLDRIATAVEAEILHAGPQRAQWGAPCAFAATDVEHRSGSGVRDGISAVATASATLRASRRAPPMPRGRYHWSK
jgi:hypothetical protein